MDSIILYVVLVVASFALIQGCLFFAADMREESRSLANELRLRRPTLADGVSPWLREILLTAPIRSFDNLVQTCGLTVRTERVLLGMMAIAVLAVVLLDVWFPVFSLVGGLVLGVGLPFIILRRMRKSRMAKLTRQLPETLLMMVRSLKAGHPIPACIAMIGKEMPTPVGSEFKRVSDSMSYGLDLRDALTKMTERLHTVPELKYIGSAIKIQSSTGGNLAEILNSLIQRLSITTSATRDCSLETPMRRSASSARLSASIPTARPFRTTTVSPSPPRATTPMRHG